MQLRQTQDPNIFLEEWQKDNAAAGLGLLQADIDRITDTTTHEIEETKNIAGHGALIVIPSDTNESEDGLRNTVTAIATGIVDLIKRLIEVGIGIGISRRRAMDTVLRSSRKKMYSPKR